MDEIKATAKWKIRIEVVSQDGTETTGSATSIEVSGAWEESEDCRCFLECFCVDVGSMVGALEKVGYILTGGDAIEGFRDGYSG